MITISLNQPFFGEQKILYCVEPRISENKCFSFQVDFYPRCIFEFEFRLNRKQDHGGFEVNFGIFGLTAMFQFYDKRHWNYDAERYMTPEEVELELKEELVLQQERKEFQNWKASRQQNVHVE